MTDWLKDKRELLETLAGKTIQRAAYVGKDSTVCLWLDDGRMIDFSGIWCNDSTADVDVSEGLWVDVAECLACGAEHKDAQVCVGGWPYGNHDRTKPLPRNKSFAWCALPNNGVAMILDD